MQQANKLMIIGLRNLCKFIFLHDRRNEISEEAEFFFYLNKTRLSHFAKFLGDITNPSLPMHFPNCFPLAPRYFAIDTLVQSFGNSLSSLYNTKFTKCLRRLRSVEDRYAIS